MFNPFNLIAWTGSLSQPRFCRSNHEIWLTRVDFIGEVRARLGSLQRPRDPDPEGLGGKLFCHKGALQDFPSWLRAIWWDVALTGARGVHCLLGVGRGLVVRWDEEGPQFQPFSEGCPLLLSCHFVVQ